MSSNQIHLTSPHAHTYTIHIFHFTHTAHTPLLKAIRCQKYPSATPQKIPIFITTSLSLIKRTHTHKMIILLLLLLLLLLKYTSFFPNYVGFLGFVLVRVFSQRKQQTKPEPSHPPIINTPLSLSPYFMSLAYLSFLPYASSVVSFPFLCPYLLLVTITSPFFSSLVS